MIEFLAAESKDLKVNYKLNRATEIRLRPLISSLSLNFVQTQKLSFFPTLLLTMVCKKLIFYRLFSMKKIHWLFFFGDPMNMKVRFEILPHLANIF